jgi:dienelactone hydrolase
VSSVPNPPLGRRSSAGGASIQSEWIQGATKASLPRNGEEGGINTVDESKIAATGYCFGGGVTWRLTTQSPWVRAAAPFYGSSPPLADIPNIRAAVLGVYGELDERLNHGIPAIRSALEAAGIVHRIVVYPNSPHGFHSDTGSSFRPDTARQAWIDTLNWFAEHLELPAPSVS